MEVNTLIFAGKEPAGPLSRGDGLVLSAADGSQYDESREIVGVCPKAIQDPGPHAWTTGNLGAGVHVGMGWIVVDLTGVHGADDRYVVRDGPDFRKLIANALFGFAIFLKGMLGAEAFKSLALKLGDRLPFRE